MKRKTILIKLTNQTSDQVNIVTVRFISSALSFPISRLFAFLFASSVYIDFISIFRSNRCGMQERMKKEGSIKCYSCFTLTTSQKHIVAYNEEAKWTRGGEQKPKQHQFVATSDLSLDIQINRERGEKRVEIRSENHLPCCHRNRIWT